MYAEKVLESIVTAYSRQEVLVEHVSFLIRTPKLIQYSFIKWLGVKVSQLRHLLIKRIQSSVLNNVS